MPSLGLNIEGDFLQLILLEKRKNSPHILYWEELPFQNSPFFSDNALNVKLLYSHFSSFCKKRPWTVTALSAEKSVVRQFPLKITSKRTIRSLLPLQAETVVPFSPEETILFSALSPVKDQKRSSFLCATSFSHLESHIQSWQNIGIDPDQVCSASSALARFAHFYVPNHPSFFLLHIGAEQTSWIVQKDRQTLFSFSFPLGVSSLSKEPSLLKSYQNHLQKIAGFLREKEIDLSSFPHLYTGIFSSFPQLTALLETELGPSLHVEKDPQLLRFALPLGAALEGVSQDANRVQFRQKQFSSKSQQKQDKKGRLLFALCCLGLSLFLFLADHFVSLYETKKAEQRIFSLLQKELPLNEGIAALEAATQEKTLSSSLLPTAPKVSDLLEWASTQPQLNALDKRNHLEIAKIRYVIEKMPTLFSAEKSMQAFVEMEIFSSSPHLAREFHQSLLKGDYLVNEKKEISWKGQRNTYWTKFYVKQQKQSQ